MENRIAAEINSEEGGNEGDEIDGVDPDEVVELDEEPAVEAEGPTPERFEEFLDGVETDRVETDAGEDDPIDASMDELFDDR
ncbi:hypothetical protein ACFQH2_16200 [Natronoarchaeum sp. GCM10025703]|uniref:hypothetical protein n=1 Tax=unclassified Natronoarchaeum TaxID=2620183 RepID=UPI003620FF01